jgi:hypothetical protein
MLNRIRKLQAKFAWFKRWFLTAALQPAAL